LSSEKKHPYKNLANSKFWSSVRNEEFLVDLFKPKFTINTQDKIATAGSCFAQNITKLLRNSDCNLLDYEQPPKDLPEFLYTKYGYKMFSCRYGNIYTVASLVQLLKEAFNIKNYNYEVWKNENENFCDPSRPNITEGGFDTLEELNYNRTIHLEEVKRLFSNLDIFIFTLGLTESWMNIEDGFVFPIAPGVIAGRYNKTNHAFKNFTYNEIISDFEEFVSILQSVNKNFKILLTVSPVPLAATASDKNVLYSTIHSKSILRSVCSYLYEKHEFIDYFPSFEIFCNPWSSEDYYEDNRRDVSAEGVEVAMNLFFSSFKLKLIKHESEQKPNPNDEKFDTVCEEEILNLKR